MAQNEKINTKMENKTFLNAIYIFLAVLIILGSLVTLYYSSGQYACNNDVNILLINKTQTFIEKQRILIERTSDIDARNVYQLFNKTEEADAYQTRIRNGYEEYSLFLHESSKGDKIIDNKMKSCMDYSKYTDVSLTITAILAAIQLIIALNYLRQYWKE